MGELKIGSPRVVMKLDIECSEVDVVPDLIFSGSLQHINIMMVEWHQRLEKTTERKEMANTLQLVMKKLSAYAQSVKSKDRLVDFRIEEFDDESYHKHRPPFTGC